MTPVRRLPVCVPLVQAETLDSYLSRLASGNHLDPRDLRAHLGMRTRTQPPNLDRLAAISGQSPLRLTSVLADACPPPGRSRLSPLSGRVACRRCTTHRGIFHDVHCVNADQRVCRRHRRWLGGLSENTTYQHDVMPLPEVVHAQRRHYQLIRRHGPDRGRSAIYWANTMVDRWTTRGEWDEHRRLTAYLAARPAIAQSDTSMLRMLNYPEIVTLANLLASEPWRAIASADRRDERLPFDLEVASQLNLAHIGFGPDDPLVAWQEGAALARRQKLHEQPGHHGPEVWLSRPHELQ